MIYRGHRRVSLSTQTYKYFDNFELRDDGIAIIRLNGPEKMNTISTGYKNIDF